MDNQQKQKRQHQCKKKSCDDHQYNNYRKKLGTFSKIQCPLTRKSLGRKSWSILHTFIAYYPQQPTLQQKQFMSNFLIGFKNLFPCQHCREHFKKDYQADPPNVDNHQQLNLWACRQHNYVNKMLRKNLFQCNYQNLMKRWKTGCNSDHL